MTNIVSSPLTWKQTGLFRESVSCDNYTGSIAIIVEYFMLMYLFNNYVMNIHSSTWYDLRLTSVRIH